jgi:hypothetical protein
MKYILIQILFNIMIFRFFSEKGIRVYKKIAYLIYPVLISIVIILSKNTIVQNKNYGVAFDITCLYSTSYFLMLSLIIVVQIIFDSVLSVVMRKS